LTRTCTEPIGVPVA